MPDARALIVSDEQTAERTILRTLRRFGDGALRFAWDAGVRLVPLRERERYRDASHALRRLSFDVDDWPIPPAGLFVVEERRVYLRSLGAMTVAHELYAVDYL